MRTQRAMGIRATAATVQTLSPFDRTMSGAYWFDLRARRPAAARLKRMLDVLGAAVLIVLLAPLMLLVAILGRGPAIVVERRIGFRGNEFAMYRFRTLRFLRRYYIDELAQLFNVLDGSMSLVGPRPLLLSDLDRLPMRGQMRRFSVPPGITGLWQVSGRGDATELDRRYINEWSLWLDVKILARTIVVVLRGRHALCRTSMRCVD